MIKLSYTRFLLALLVFFSLTAFQYGQEGVKLLAVTDSMKSPDPDRPLVVLPVAKTAKFIFQSADAGKTWQDMSAGLPSDVQGGRLFVSGKYVMLNAENGLFHTAVHSGSLVWKEDIILDQKIPYIFPGLSALYGYNPATGFFKEMQGSGIWIALGNTLNGRAVNDFVETTDGSIVIASPSGIFKSMDGCKSWKQVFGDTWVSDLIAADGLMYAGGAHGLYRSADRGEHWEMIKRDMGDAYQLTTINGGLVAIFTGGATTSNTLKSRMMVSYDKGETWKPIDQNLHAGKYIYDIEKAGDYLFCSLDAGIYRSADNGKTWELVRPSRDKERVELAVSGQTVIAVLSWGGC